MSGTFNIYCDESCHLEHDGQRAMVLGAVWCALEKTREIASRVREIKIKHRLPPAFEVKWSKVSPAKQAFYMELLDYFFDDDDVHYRALVVPEKGKIQHGAFAGQTHDNWYYKMYFDLLNHLLDPHAEYRIYLDIKDTRSAERIRKLHDVLCNNMYDFERRIITRVQTVRSHEVEQIQLADLLTGVVSYANREIETSAAKLALVERMRRRSGYSLRRSTLLRESKVNIFRWQAQEPQS
jgi:hypothetical protein